MKIKENKGIGLTDTVVAIAIFIIFSSLIISLSYNIYLQSNFIKRNDSATNYIVEIFEYAKAMEFDQLNKDTLLEYVNSNIASNANVHGVDYKPINLESGYTIEVDVSNLKTENVNIETVFLKQIDLTVYYKLGSKTKSVTMSTIIKR